MKKESTRPIVIDKSEETRSLEIANMINEGGLGSEEYYIILKHHQEDSMQSDAG